MIDISSQGKEWVLYHNLHRVSDESFNVEHGAPRGPWKRVNLGSTVVKDQTLTLLELRTQVPSIDSSMRRDCKLSYHLQMSVERPVE